MKIKHINTELSVSDQITVNDLDELASAGIKSLICNRPDHETEPEHTTVEIEQHARQLGIELHYLPVEHATIDSDDVRAFEAAFVSTPKPVHAYCRSGLRAITLWSLLQIKQGAELDSVNSTAQQAGYDFGAFGEKFSAVIEQLKAERPIASATHAYELVIVGAGAAGISVASSLLARRPGVKIALIDPAELHYYQPGFTMVGGGVFTLPQTRKSMESVIPQQVSWIKAAVTTFTPDSNRLTLDSGATVSYDRLIVCPGLMLDWDAVEGLRETLGSNGVTSNYDPACSAYTWELVQGLKSGKAIFTQPPMPIKCAGAPQKAMYLSADHWFKRGLLDHVDVEFYNAGAVLFGVADYVPALQTYVDKYNAALHFGHRLVKVDGAAKKAWFEHVDSSGKALTVETNFDMLHVCPPQKAPDFIRNSPLADEAGWVDVDQYSLRHKTYSNIWSLGDVANTPNAKTAAAVRKQAPIVAHNIAAEMSGGAQAQYFYDGYGSCPLTVERGKIVLAEFGYGGKLLPTFPTWLLKGTQPGYLAWVIKAWLLPKVYWQGMLKGHEWLAQPTNRTPPQ